MIAVYIIHNKDDTLYCTSNLQHFICKHVDRKEEQKIDLILYSEMAIENKHRLYVVTRFYYIT